MHLLILALIDLQGHDTRLVRDIATHSVHHLNMRYDLRRFVRQGEGSKDAEVARRCRLINEWYTRVCPPCGYYPRFDLMAVDGIENEVLSVELRYGFDRGPAGWVGYYSGDKKLRLATSELCQRMLAMGLTRWEVIRRLNVALKKEKEMKRRPCDVYQDR